MNADMSEKVESAWHYVLLCMVIFVMACFVAYWHTQPLIVLVLSYALVAFAAAGCGRYGAKAHLWTAVFIDDRNTYSLSRLQIAFWSWVVLGGLLGMVLINLGEGDEKPLSIVINEQLLTLMAISFASGAGSKLIIGAKQDAATPTNGATPASAPFKNQDPTQATWSQLLTGDFNGDAETLDISRVQMLFLSAILAVGYLILVFTKIGQVTHEFPPIASQLVTLIGVSHGGYLVSKMAPVNAKP